MSKFTNEPLGFECEVPEGWLLLPAPWVKKFRLSAAPTSGQLAQALSKAESPFLCMYLPQADPAAPVPTVQCTVKSAEHAELLGGLPGVLDAVMPQMHASFPGLQVIQRSDEYLVAGRVGAYLKTSMTVLNDQGGSFACASELVLLETDRLLYMVGLSGAADEASRPLEDFNAILRSIRVH